MTMAIPKQKPVRSRKLRESARGQECTLCSPWCNGDTTTTVLAHSNWSEDGKGGARKADDLFACVCCSGCHRWLDEGPEPVEEKRDLFHRAMKRTWRLWYDEGLVKVEGAQ